MATKDKCCTVVPYFKINDGKLNEFKKICEKCVEKASQESKCIYYGFSFNENQAFCREGYEDAEGLLAHIDNIGSLLEEILKVSKITCLEVHGEKDEIEKLKEPLAGLNPKYFILECGFRK